MGFVLYRVIVSAEFIIGGNEEKGLTFCALRCYEGENWKVCILYIWGYIFLETVYLTVYCRKLGDRFKVCVNSKN